jgi:CheY-like chemotaxis protein
VRALKILVAEDNPVNQLYVMDQLEFMGHTTVLAEDGAVALQLLAEHGDFDLVLMDVQMPNMDGVEATRRIRAGEVPGVAADLPIVAVTAHALKGDRESFLEAGMDDYVSKPIAEEALRTVLARAAAREAGTGMDGEG